MERPPDGRWRALPPAFQVRHLPEYGTIAVPHPLGVAAKQMADGLLAGEWRSRAAIRNAQLQQVRRLVGWAARYSPFYAERLRSAGVRPEDLRSMKDLAAIPLLTRRDLQDHFDAIKCRALPPGTSAAGEVETSGSSGSPVKVLATNVTRLVWAACFLRDETWSGVDPRGVLVSLRHFLHGPEQARSENGCEVPNWGGMFGQSFVTGPLYMMDVSVDPELQLRLLRRAEPHYILSYPTNLEMLADLARRNGWKPKRLRLIRSISEILWPHTRQTVQETFGAPVVDLYSSGEFGYLASECPSGNGYHIHDENVLVELLTESGGPCPPGRPGRLVITALNNFATPLIRYEVGDYAVGLNEPCPCGRGLHRLVRIIGRQRGTVKMRDGSVRYAGELLRAVRRTWAVRQYRIVQHAIDRFEVVIVPHRHFGPEHEQQVRQRFAEFLGYPVEVSFTKLESIPRTPGGKYLDFDCRVRDERAEGQER